MKRSKTFLTKAAMLLIVALFSLTGARAQKALPYEYGFENNDLAAEGWTKVSVGSVNDSKFGVAEVASQTGDYGFRFSSYERDNTSYDQYLISPKLDAFWGSVSVRFSYAASNDYSTSSYYGPEKFKVGYSTTDTDPSSFTFGEEIQATTTSWILYDGAFPAGTKYVAIYYYSDYAYYLYVDDFVFEEFAAITISGTESFDESTNVEITFDGVEGATILYSTDGGTSWNTYQGTFTLTETTTVKAKATKDGRESPEVSKVFVKEGDTDDFMWDLKTTPTGTTSTTSVTWTNASDGTSTNAKMTLAKGTSSYDANYRLGGSTIYNQTINYTGMYSGQTLTFEPVGDYVITSIKMTTPANSGYGWNATYYGNNLNDRMTLRNGTKTHTNNSTDVTITPTDGSVPVVATFFGEVRVTGVTVEYAPASSPYIAIWAQDKEVNLSSASVPDATLLTTKYNRVSNSDATVVLYDENKNVVDGNTYNGITVTLDADKNLTYTVTANTTTTARTVYVKVTAGGIESPVIAIIQAAAIVLANSGDNTNLILEHRGEKCCVILADRTFSTGKWYTLCLPFNMKIANSPLARADVRGLDEENTRIEGKTLKLEFTSVDSLKAGEPRIIRWESGDDIVNPVFTDVTIKPEMNDFICNIDESKSVYFKGTYASTTYTAADKSMLFISNNTFYSVGKNTTIDAQRGYFQLNGFSYDPSSTSAGGVKEFGITFDEDDPDGINDVNVNLDDDESIYNVAGQRLGRMQKGINIVNGKKIFVK